MSIVAERAKYETFLRELDKDSGSKPANVVARVRADYTARLANIVEQLRASQDVLERHATSLTTRLQKLREAEQRLLDEAAELDLRKQVGEIPEEEWATAVERVKSDASKIKSQQEVTSGDIKRIRDILGSMSAPPADTGTPTPAVTPAVDELAFLKSVVGSSTGALPVPPRPSTSKATPKSTAPTAPRRSTVKPIGSPPRPSTKGPAARPTTARPVEPLIEPDPMSVPAAPVVNASAIAPAKQPTPASAPLIEQPQSELTITPKSAADGGPLASNVPTGELNLKALGFSASQKKAKCPKCGGPNVPSDWYCVHCGAELAI